MDEKIVAPDQARLETITRCEMQIEEGKRRGRDAIRIIAKALNKINHERLYLDRGYETFNAYAEGHLRMDRHVAGRIMAASDTILTLEAAGIEITAIPAVEAQLVLLSKLPKQDLAQTWVEGLKFLEEKGLPINTSNIKRIVDIKLSQLPADEPAKKGVNPKLSIEEDDGDGARTFSEDAELAIERIERLTGEDIRTAISSGLTISDRDLIRWSQENDEMVRNLKTYIIDDRWSVGKALAYESSLITENTTLGALARLGTARGGAYKAEVYIGNTTWTVELTRQ
jgi:hypothetical protein